MRKIKPLVFSFCILAFLFVSPQLRAQTSLPTSKEDIAAKSRLWNTSYNSRDSLTFYTLFDTAAILTSAGGKWVGGEKCKDLCRFLYKRRPDITWTNELTQIEINEQWKVAYETGNWTEAWIQPGDTSKSVIKGKYWIMWRFRDNEWKILSGIFTPLSCTGSYCTK